MANTRNIGIIYCATNLISGKKYIGYTMTPLYKRIQSHKHKASTKDSKYHSIFRLAIKKYGIENFKWQVLAVVNGRENAKAKEKELIEKYNTFAKNGYNISKGGNGGFISLETNLKISNTLKAKIKSGEIDIQFKNLSYDKRLEMANKAWETKRNNGYVPKKGFNLTESCKNKMSKSKNEKNRINWINTITGESLFLSTTELSRLKNIGIPILAAIKNGRVKKSKTGWKVVER